MSAFQALMISTLAVLPGALFTFSYERQTHIVRAALADRVLRLTAGSAVFYLAFAPLVYWIYLTYVRSGQLGRGPLPWGLWLVPLVLIAGPLAAGILVGGASRRGYRWARLLSGQAPEPRAWDALFARGYQRSAWLRIRLKDSAGGTDGWLLGVFAPRRGELPSFAAGYPDPPDLYLSDTADAEPRTGRFVLENGKPRMRGVGLWIGWEQIAYIEVIWEAQQWEAESVPADPGDTDHVGEQRDERSEMIGEEMPFDWGSPRGHAAVHGREPSAMTSPPPAVTVDSAAITDRRGPDDNQDE